VKRAVTYGGTGSNIVPTEYLADSFIDVLRNRSVVMPLATMLPGLVGNVEIGKKTGSSSASWIAGDNSDSLSESTPVFDQVTLSPKTVGGLITVSHRMLRQSSPAVEMLLRQDLADMLAVEIDMQALQGDGTGNKPVGVLNTTGVGTATYTNGGAPSWANITGLEGIVAASNADRGSLAYLTTPTMAATLKSTDVGTDTGRFIWTSGKEQGTGEMNGLPAYSSGNVPAGRVVFGNWADVLIGTWGVIEIDADPYGANFSKGSVSVRALMDVDVGVRHPQSFAVLSEAA